MQNTDNSLFSNNIYSDALSWLNSELTAFNLSTLAFLDDSGKMTKIPTPRKISGSGDGSPIYRCSPGVSKNGAKTLSVRFNTFKHGGYNAYKLFVECLDKTLPLPTATAKKRLTDDYTQPKTVKKVTCDFILPAYDMARESGTSPYLVRKQVADYADAIKGIRYAGNSVIIPIYNAEGFITSYQTIHPNGAKIFAKGGGTSGSFAVIGELPEKVRPNHKFYIVEGVATGLSVHAKMGGCVIAAMTAGNIEKTINSLIVKYKTRKLNIELCPDNDAFDKHGIKRELLNPGLEAAYKAALKYKINKIVFPPNTDGKCTDFNDLHCASSLGHVECVINSFKPRNAEIAFYKDKREQKEYLSKVKSSAYQSVINQKYLGDIELKPGINIIKSAKGTGKTYALKSVADNASSFLYVSHLQSLTYDAAERLELEHYLSDNIKNHGLKIAKHLSICINSLYKLANYNPTPVYDVVVIDEVEQLLSVISGKLEHKSLVIQTLRYLITSAKHIVLMDADQGKATEVFIKGIFNNQLIKYNKIINLYQPEHGRKMIVYDNEGSLQAEVMKQVAEDKRCFISFNSKKKARAFFEQFKTNALLITGDNTGGKEQQGFLKNPNKFLQENDYKLVITSPAVSTGLSIDVLENGLPAFDFVAGFYSNGINNISDCYQAFSRVRGFRPVHVFVEDSYKTESLEPDYSFLGMNSNGETYQIDIELNTLNTQLRGLKQTYRKADFKAFYMRFIKKAVLDGFNISFVGETEEAKELAKKIKAEGKEAIKNQVLNAKILDSDTAEALNNKHAKTQEESDALEKFYISEFYSGALELGQAYDYDKNGKGRAAIRALETAFLTDADKVKIRLNNKISFDADTDNSILLGGFVQQLMLAVGLACNRSLERNTESLYSAESENILNFLDWCDRNYQDLALVGVPQFRIAKAITEPDYRMKFIGWCLKLIGLGHSRAGKNENAQYSVCGKKLALAQAIINARAK